MAKELCETESFAAPTESVQVRYFLEKTLIECVKSVARTKFVDGDYYKIFFYTATRQPNATI